MDQFEAYFRRADLDGDGRISGAEAVFFLQGANLPKQVLAQIWMHADQSHTGFLGRGEFYNALKLVTVAQSKRELTPDIVKAALYGPAAAKIPPPKINPPATPVQQSMRPPQAIPPGNASRPPQGIISPEFSRGGSMVGHSQAMPTSTASGPPQAILGSTSSTGMPGSNISTGWISGKTTAALTGPPSTSNTTMQPQTQVSLLSQPTASDSKASIVSGNGFATDSSFGGDVFSAISSTGKKETSVPAYSSSGPPALATAVPASSGGHLPVKSNSLDSLQSALAMQPLGGGQLQRAQSLPTSGQQVSASSSSSLASPSISLGLGSSSDDSQIPWPKMKPSDVQKYTKVFVEVDTDRDGRITGEQARNLFLSWRLPREVLKQVWDLSDQDSDSMLSLREFCFALI
ncbi:hypothetical protein GH714_007372 [Hevea brasiliensis]|uniref:Uncharacterized protein n=1 Tax=Hevea brasiliensis TaxID=3981 RepID=A0A6A6ME37_HEVBR|nr:hypothetical protein GH714_007372 [Hevea brasiliensis]